MRFSGKEKEKQTEPLRGQLEKLLNGLGYKLIELVISGHKRSVQVRLVIYNGSFLSTDDCSKAYRSVMPSLELAYPGQEISLEVSSPGTDRLIKDGQEFLFYIDKPVRCYRTDISDWTQGVVKTAGEDGICLETDTEIVKLSFDIIAKAKLNLRR